MKTITKPKNNFEFSSLSTRKRASLAHALIQSLDTKIDDNVDKSWDTEVQKRVQKFSDGKSQDYPAFEILDTIKNKY